MLRHGPGGRAKSGRISRRANWKVRSGASDKQPRIPRSINGCLVPSRTELLSVSGSQRKSRQDGRLSGLRSGSPFRTRVVATDPTDEVPCDVRAPHAAGAANNDETIRTLHCQSLFVPNPPRPVGVSKRLRSPPPKPSCPVQRGSGSEASPARPDQACSNRRRVGHYPQGIALDRQRDRSLDFGGLLPRGPVPAWQFPTRHSETPTRRRSISPAAHRIRLHSRDACSTERSLRPAPSFRLHRNFAWWAADR